MRSPVAISNGCAPVLASYSAITLFTSSMSAVAGSYSRSVVSPWDENVRILAVMFGLLRDVHLRSSAEQQSAGFEVPFAHIAPFLRVVKTQGAFRPVLSRNKRIMKNPKAGWNASGSTLAQLSSS